MQPQTVQFLKCEFTDQAVHLRRTTDKDFSPKIEAAVLAEA